MWYEQEAILNLHLKTKFSYCTHPVQQQEMNICVTMILTCLQYIGIQAHSHTQRE